MKWKDYRRHLATCNGEDDCYECTHEACNVCLEEITCEEYEEYDGLCKCCHEAESVE